MKKNQIKPVGILKYWMRQIHTSTEISQVGQIRSSTPANKFQLHLGCFQSAVELQETMKNYSS